MSRDVSCRDLGRHHPRKIVGRGDIQLACRPDRDAIILRIDNREHERRRSRGRLMWEDIHR